MEKLDAKFTGEIRKVKDGSVVPDDEYVVFLAKDNAFANYALPSYLDGCVNQGADEEQIEAVKRMMGRVRDWREANPGRCKTPDAAGEKLLDQPGVLRLGHQFRARQYYEGKDLVTNERACGFVTDPMLNAPAFDPVHCNRTPEEH